MGRIRYGASFPRELGYRSGMGLDARPPRSPQGERFDPPVAVVRFTVDRRCSGADVERELALRAGLGADALERSVRHGGLWLDRRLVPPGQLPLALEPGQSVAVYVLAREPEPIPLPASAILLDREGIVAAAKPAWLPVQGTRASQLFSLEALLRARLGEPALRAVHRLDRQTSGAVLFARDGAVAGRLGRALMRHAVARTYLAVVAPVPTTSAFSIAGELAPATVPPRWRFELHPAPVPGSRPSATRFRVLAREGERALLECAPQTGRTHQIRVHLASAGTPIAGDELYGAPCSAGGVQRTLLHAWRLAGPVLPEPLEAPVPADFPDALLAAAECAREPFV